MIGKRENLVKEGLHDAFVTSRTRIPITWGYVMGPRTVEAETNLIMSSPEMFRIRHYQKPSETVKTSASIAVVYGVGIAFRVTVCVLVEPQRVAWRLPADRLKLYLEGGAYRSLKMNARSAPRHEDHAPRRKPH